jgi:hypothetical protein
MAQTTFGVSVAYDKTSYNAGETMTITLSGNATFVGDEIVGTTPASVVCTVTADNGSVTEITASGATITTTIPAVPQTLNVVLTALVDGARVWTIAADGKSATAIA